MRPSDVSAGDLSPGDELWLCREADWLVREVDFSRVKMVERRGSRIVVQSLSDATAGGRASVFGSDLCTERVIEAARDRRDRDLVIAQRDAEQPLDAVTECAVEICVELATGQPWYPLEGPVLGLMRRVGLDGRVAELAPEAYLADGLVYAPDSAWVNLVRRFAASESALVAERLDEVADRPRGHSGHTLTAAKAMVRRWAGLEAASAAGASSNGRTAEAAGSEVVRLRALIELAADALDAAGDAATATQLRRAAFPDRFRGSAK